MDGDFENLTATGQAAFGGTDFHTHCIAQSGLNANPLVEESQVAWYAAIKGNEYATDHVGGFESALGLDAGVTCANINDFVTSALDIGAGSSVTRHRQFAYNDVAAGSAGDAVFANANDNSFTGNWFLHYGGTRPSRLGGDLGIGIDPAAVTDSRTIALNATTNAFIRLYIGGVEKGRITVTNGQFTLDNLAGGVVTINPSGGVKIPALAGSGTRPVYASSTGVLSA